MFLSKLQVIESQGDKGHNVEYVLKLAEWMRGNLPNVQDDHLFQIEKAVRQKIDEFGLCLISLMGDSHETCHQPLECQSIDTENNDVANDSRSDHDHKDGPRFSTQVRPKCLRCVKV